MALWQGFCYLAYGPSLNTPSHPPLSSSWPPLLIIPSQEPISGLSGARWGARVVVSERRKDNGSSGRVWSEFETPITAVFEFTLETALYAKLLKSRKY